ncbi:MAG: PaaI family thioesterase [Crocinitomicaceae bacterium]|nr:PaaI family thioesterase [Crocinitomicaceae bacterium]
MIDKKIGQKILTLYQQSNNYGNLLGMELEIARPGEVAYHLLITAQLLATPIAAHGGVVASLIDGAIGVAGLSLVMDEEKVVSTVELKMNFLAPAFEGDRLTAFGKVQHKGKRLLFVECEVINQSGSIIAKGSGTLNAYPAKKIFVDL